MKVKNWLTVSLFIILLLVAITYLVFSTEGPLIPNKTIYSEHKVTDNKLLDENGEILVIPKADVYVTVSESRVEGFVWLKVDASRSTNPMSSETTYKWFLNNIPVESGKLKWMRSVPIKNHTVYFEIVDVSNTAYNLGASIYFDIPVEILR